MAHHRIYIGENCTREAEMHRITGPEAEHALRVKRLGPGTAITLFDGAGRVVEAEMVETDKRTLLARSLSELRVEPPSPAAHVRAATAKGERTDRMLEALSQLGAASYAPLRTERSVVHPRDAKQERWRRLAIESAKQCGRAHLLRIEPMVELAGALRQAPGERERVVLDATGGPYTPMQPTAEIELYIGPEGGWSDEELLACQAAGATIVALPTHTLRIETAAVAGLAVVLQEQHRLRQREDT